MVYFCSSAQEDIFKCCAHDVVTSVLEGYNGSIIASGQTGGLYGYFVPMYLLTPALPCHQV